MSLLEELEAQAKQHQADLRSVHEQIASIRSRDAREATGGAAERRTALLRNDEATQTAYWQVRNELDSGITEVHYSPQSLYLHSSWPRADAAA